MTAIAAETAPGHKIERFLPEKLGHIGHELVKIESLGFRVAPDPGADK
jgi:hypothetical protein